MSDIHKYDDVSLTTAAVGKGFVLFYDDAIVGNIERVVNSWMPKIHGSRKRAMFNSLKAAEYFALSTFIEHRNNEEIENDAVVEADTP